MAKINLGFNFFLVGPRIGFNPFTGPAGSGGDESGPRKKNLLSKRVGFVPWVLACKSGPGMKKPDPNLTRCHFYLLH